jgi:hypothetical protein
VRLVASARSRAARGGPRAAGGIGGRDSIPFGDTPAAHPKRRYLLPPPDPARCAQAASTRDSNSPRTTHYAPHTTHNTRGDTHDARLPRSRPARTQNPEPRTHHALRRVESSRMRRMARVRRATLSPRRSALRVRGGGGARVRGAQRHAHFVQRCRACNAAYRSRCVAVRASQSARRSPAPRARVSAAPASAPRPPQRHAHAVHRRPRVARRRAAVGPRREGAGISVWDAPQAYPQTGYCPEPGVRRPHATRTSARPHNRTSARGRNRASLSATRPVHANANSGRACPPAPPSPRDTPH